MYSIMYCCMYRSPLFSGMPVEGMPTDLCVYLIHINQMKSKMPCDN